MMMPLFIPLIASALAAQTTPARISLAPPVPIPPHVLRVCFTEEEYQAIKLDALGLNMDVPKFIEYTNRRFAKDIMDRHRSEIELMQVNELMTLWNQSDYNKRSAVLNALRAK